MGKNWKIIVFGLLAVAYLLSPLDIIPDVTPVFGLLDDLIVLAVAYLKWRANLKAKKIDPKSGKSEVKKKARVDPRTKIKDPYRVLGLCAPASQREIKTAFKNLAREYHPDRALIKGEEAVMFANERMIEISNAYNKLRKVA